MKVSPLLTAFISGIVVLFCSIATAQQPVIGSAAERGVGATSGGGCVITIYSISDCDPCTTMKNKIFEGGDPNRPKSSYACNKITYVPCGKKGAVYPRCMGMGGFPITIVNGTRTNGYGAEYGKTPVEDNCTCPTPTPTPPPGKTPGSEASPPPQQSPTGNPCTGEAKNLCTNPSGGISCCLIGCDASNKQTGCSKTRATPTPAPKPTKAPPPTTTECPGGVCPVNSPKPLVTAPPPKDTACPGGVCPIGGQTPNPLTTPLLPPMQPTPVCEDETCPAGQKCNDAGKCAPSQPQVVPPYSDTAQPSDCPPATSCDALKCDPSKTACKPGADERGCPINICAALPPSVLVTPTEAPAGTSAPTPMPSASPSPGGKCTGDRLTKLCEAPNKASWTCCLPTERCVTNGSGLATCQP